MNKYSEQKHFTTVRTFKYVNRYFGIAVTQMTETKAMVKKKKRLYIYKFG